MSRQDSPASLASSNSTTPPSEATLADDQVGVSADSMVVEQARSHRFTSDSSRPTNEPASSTGVASATDRREEVMPWQEETKPKSTARHLSGNMDTKNDSSVAEDYDSYAASKYEIAEQALLSYSRTNKLDKLQALLEAKSRNEIVLNLNYKGQQKQNFSWSALHLACYFGHIEVVEQLLTKKQYRDELDINIQNNSGDTPLHKASLTNRSQIVQLLLSHGSNVFVKNCDGLLAKQLTTNRHVFEMLEAAEQADTNRIIQDMFKAVDNCDLKRLQEYFTNFDLIKEAPGASIETTSGHHDDDDCQVANNLHSGGDSATVHSNNTSLPTTDFINRMTDERGNTLLHLASMRGFKAICVYLLEQGFDPFKKNNFGQTCVDLSSYQLRQLFLSVKPSENQIKRLSRDRVTRFEGPLMKKVRILGWKQIYVVLENGVILLFNNRRDSINRSRKGYKYLESASCEPDLHDVGVFTICFSDRSRATFLVSSEHSNQYTTYKTNTQPHGEQSARSSAGQVELIRQKWIDSIRDHIVYSTEFIRRGLKFDDDDCDNDTCLDGSDFSNLNYLLPIDTIKSFIQEARAHYSILERHADHLNNLVQSISSAPGLVNNSLELSQQQHELEVSSTTASNIAPPSTGNRLLGFIRPSSRFARGGLAAGSNNLDEIVSASFSGGRRQQQNVSSGTSATGSRLRNSSLTNEFVQDSWPCLLFHLRLLMESTENTKTSMGQALALMEHQEQLRQNKIQDQEERCRVLEDSLHALARDHHELEKSLSMSQIYHSVGCRSMSISTDLNEYHDAFEDFDDEKTMTPSSLPSDEELDKRIQEVINGDDLRSAGCSRQKLPETGGVSFLTRRQSFRKDASLNKTLGLDNGDDDDDETVDEDDLQSNCSALTADTVTDQYLSVAESNPLSLADGNRESKASKMRNRSTLPAPMVPRDQVSIWSILKNCIGKELSKITMPVVFNEPLTMLQRACEGIQYSEYLKLADQSDDPVERMELVCTFILACLSVNCHRIVKPFNPLLYETYEYDHEFEDGSHVRGIAQQVSHHPPITAVSVESDTFIYEGVVNPKIKFWGRSVEVSHDGACKIHLKTRNETYVFKAVPCSIHNIIVGKLWFEHHGPLDIKCAETRLQANLVFKQTGWFSNDLHRFDGFIVSSSDEKSGTNSEKVKLRFLYGKWSDYVKSVDYQEYEKYLRENQQKLFKIPDNPDHSQPNGLVNKLQKMSVSASSSNNNANNDTDKSHSTSSPRAAGDKKLNNVVKADSIQSLDIPNSRTLWRLDVEYLADYYNFTTFTMRLNELTPELEKTLPRTDSRFRPDVRKLEEGDLDAAANEKQRLEEKQRAARNRDKRFKDPSPDFLWFKPVGSSSTKDQMWTYQGGYWESKSCNSEKFPDLF